MNSKTFDEQCRLCRFLKNPLSCGNGKITFVKGVNVCLSYEPEDV